MENDIFKAGVQPGGLTSHDEVKMLVCFILSKLEDAMNFSQLHEALAENGLVNYFELVQVVEELLDTGHIVSDKDRDGERYAVTDLGKQAAEQFTSTLPFSVRDKALKAAEKLLRRRKREAEVHVDVRPTDGGFLMELSIPEQGDNLVAFTLFLPSKEECELVRRRFLNDPVFIYNGVLALLTGNQEILGRIFPQQEPLF